MGPGPRIDHLSLGLSSRLRRLTRSSSTTSGPTRSAARDSSCGARLSIAERSRERFPVCLSIRRLSTRGASILIPPVAVMVLSSAWPLQSPVGGHVRSAGRRTRYAARGPRLRGPLSAPSGALPHALGEPAVSSARASCQSNIGVPSSGVSSPVTFVSSTRQVRRAFERVIDPQVLVTTTDRLAG